MPQLALKRMPTMANGRASNTVQSTDSFIGTPIGSVADSAGHGGIFPSVRMSDGADPELFALDSEVNFETYPELWSQDPFRLKCAVFLNSTAFKLLIILCIVLSMCFAVYETDMNASEQPTEPWFTVAMGTLTVMYMAEILLRVYTYGPNFFKDFMNLFETFIVVVDVFFAIFENITGQAPQLFILRVCRLVRVLRIVRLLSLFRPLFLILHGFFAAMQAIFWASLLLVVFIGLWSILAVDVLHDLNKEIEHEGCERCHRAFESVAASCLTFMQSTLAGETWNDLSIPIIEKNPWTMWIFLGVHITVNMGIMNLIFAVIVDQAAQAREDDQEQKLWEKQRRFVEAKAGLYTLCSQMDIDSSGTLTGDELMQGVKNVPEFAALLKLMDVCMDDMEIIFRILDHDKSGDIDYEEFVEHLHKMKSQDSHSLLIFIKYYVLEVRDRLEHSINLFRQFFQGEQEDVKEMLKELQDELIPLTNPDCEQQVQVLASRRRRLSAAGVCLAGHLFAAHKDQVQSRDSGSSSPRAGTETASLLSSPGISGTSNPHAGTETASLLSSLDAIEREARGAIERLRVQLGGQDANMGIGAALRSTPLPEVAKLPEDMPNGISSDRHDSPITMEPSDGSSSSNEPPPAETDTDPLTRFETLDVVPDDHNPVWLMHSGVSFDGEPLGGQRKPPLVQCLSPLPQL